ncbi:G protein-coupled glucose receptor regulating Gpa2-domain-containing protein [Jackrogersella minutella]|nr:G protein-coupled glucose receptor regulating Gpa2-domain-containing protein [Jackrogersella minutella]
MAPITWQPGGPVTEFLADIIMKRESAPNNKLNDPELIALMSISLSMASLSVLAALGAFYWFVRMRRSFRHDLIMLLIQSDMMKALWLVICPLAFFAKLPIDSDSTFCQVSGFFLTLSIEASDIAVLLIAIHTALFILRPRGSNGAAGLYPYRHIAYTCWAIIPLILAAIVPLTGGRFADNGPHCYLPIRPAWYLSALSWIPRYVISAFIIATYTILYLYVTCRFRRFTKDQRRASTVHSSSDHPDQNHRKHRHHHQHSGDVPPTPPIADYGFLDSAARDSLAKDGTTAKDRHHSVDSAISTLDFGSGAGGASTPLRRPEQATTRSSIRWNTVDFANDGSGESRALSETGLLGPTSPVLAEEETAPAIQAPENAHQSPLSSQQSSHGHSAWRRSLSLRSHSRSHSLTGSVSTMISALRRGPPRARDSTQSSSSTTCSSPIFLSAAETEEAMRRSREKQRRQLRLLFVYPIIYILTWIAPFVSHVLRYDDTYGSESASGRREPVALQVVSIASLCIGAAVDCCFFSAWERPWLHLRGGFWEGLALRVRVRPPTRRARRGAGRTREERFVDARSARSRREQEENLEADAPYARRSSGFQPGAAPREWWDVLDAESGSTQLA